MVPLRRLSRLLLVSGVSFAIAMASNALAAKKLAPTTIDDVVKSLLLRRQYKSAFAKLETAAKAGNATAQYGLGNMYRLGLGVQTDFEKARLWYGKAAAKGNTSAARILTRMRTAVPVTEKKLSLRGNANPSNASELNIQLLPKRPATGQNWLALAAVRDLVPVIDKLRQSQEAAFRQLAPSALLAAARAGRASAVAALLENGTSPNTPDASGKTPAMVAAHTGNAEALRVLLTATPDLSLQDAGGNGALSISGKACNQQAFEQLLQAGAKDGETATPVLISILRRCPNPTAFLENAHGVVTTAVDSENRSVLWHAAAMADEKLLSELLVAGSDPMIADKSGYLPLHTAALAAKPENLRLLFSNSANPSPVSTAGVTPLMLAALSGCQLCVELLPHDQASSNVKDEAGDTALSYAVRALQPSIAALLVASGSNPDARNLAGDTPTKLARRLGGQIEAALQVQN